MRRIHTILAMAALFQAAAMPNSKVTLTNASEKGYSPKSSMGSNPMFSPSKSQRVKNKQSRIRRGVKL